MANVTIRDLRNHGGRVVDRVLAGESMVVTRAGRPVADLHPVPRPGLTGAELLAGWKSLPPLDAEAFRRDLDELLDPAL